MAQIRARTDSKGNTRYTAIIRLYKGKAVVHQEYRTFPRQALATHWAKRREVKLAKPEGVAVAQMGDVAIGGLIQRYIDEFEQSARWQRTKAASLRQLRGQDIAKLDALTITTDRLVRHVRERRAEGAGPATAMNDLIWIGVVFRAARAAWGVPANTEAVENAQVACRELRLTAKARQRDRTPTYEELEKLDAYFSRRRTSSFIPMRDIMWFAIYSARREAEICRLLRADNDADRNTGIVRDSKHPTGKLGNHRHFRYTPEAWAIAEMQPASKDGRIFPYNHRSICGRFTNACKLLGIEDLHFHDLRREATTRLFEQGLTIPEVAAHTAHESWSALKVYTSLVKRGKVMEAPFLSGSSPNQRAPSRPARQSNRQGAPRRPAMGTSDSRRG